MLSVPQPQFLRSPPLRTPLGSRHEMPSGMAAYSRELSGEKLSPLIRDLAARMVNTAERRGPRRRRTMT